MQRCDSSSEAATLEIAAHPHMLRHACGYQLANNGQDTRAIQHTVRYTDLSAHRFKVSWKARQCSSTPSMPRHRTEFSAAPILIPVYLLDMTMVSIMMKDRVPAERSGYRWIFW
jgi:hypothetical protein